MTAEETRQVLCVDSDEAALDRTVSTLAADERFTVDGTTDPDEVVGLVARDRVDCVLSEYELGDVDGVTLLRHVRTHAPDIAFVIYTAAGSETVASEAIAAGVTDYVVAPADADVLADRVAGAIDATASRVTARNQLREHRRFVDDALDSIGDVFYVIDTEGRLVQWNRRFNELFGYDDATIAGLRPWEFVVEEDQERVVETIDEVLAEGEGEVEVTAVLADGSRIKLDLQGRRLTDGDGNVVGLCGTGRDVTERERTEWRLRTQNERLEEFASVLSHDLRSPLSVAGGYLELAREDGTPEYLDKVATAHERMARIIDDVLTTTRQGQAVEATEAVRLDLAARDAWETVATGDATLDVQTDRVIQADPARLQRLLENLFRNSVEHGSTSSRDGYHRPDHSVKHGGEDVTVTVGATPDGFYVADDGPGIPAEVRDRAFEVGVTTGDGTGFGLAIVRSLAEAHGWTVDLTDADGGGARFEFTEALTGDD